MSKRLPPLVALALLGILGTVAVVGLALWAGGVLGSRVDSISAIDPRGVSPSRQASPGDDLEPQRVAITTDDVQLSVLSDVGQALASRYMAPINNSESLQELREAVEGRATRGLAALRGELGRLPSGEIGAVCKLQYDIATLLIYDGKLEEAAVVLQKALDAGRVADMPAAVRMRIVALQGVIAFRRGEADNCIACLGPSSCIFPIAPEAVHTNTAGSREAIRHFTTYLQAEPGDLRVRWLLNLAHMTLGEYPERVPPRYLIRLDGFRSKIDVGKFSNVAPLVGLTPRPNLAGGSVFDDFTGDGLPDLFTTSLDTDAGASLYVNRGDGTFEHRSESAGLGEQIYALNVTRADYDNDGDLDVLLLRGAWENPMRMSLLRNNGQGVFEDVTIASGLVQPIPSESAAWGDYDNDGFVDLYVCGEYYRPYLPRRPANPDPRNRGRLYRNLGNGTFVDVAAAAGVACEACSKGCAWGDYDGDGWLDLYVTDITGPCHLYHNEGNGTFRDVAAELGVTGAEWSFACWFWDYDNDGRLDLYVNDYTASVAETVAVAMGAPIPRSCRPRLYRNLGPDHLGAVGFRDVTREVGLDRPMAPMGCNFGDIDNDGYLDMYLGTGRMSLDGLVPNVLLKNVANVANVAGRRFEDVTMSSRTGHLQKGHGVSFADWDCDGDLDLFVETGGGVPGDKSYNLLFQNPGHGRHWLKVKLVGTKTNRAALGARIKAVVQGADGARRSICRTVGNNSSFGGNSLVELIGLSDAASVMELEVSWPTSRTRQTFRDIAADQMIVITEGAGSFKTVPHTPLHVPKPATAASPKRR
jgi:hypothetical protein